MPLPPHGADLTRVAIQYKNRGMNEQILPPPTPRLSSRYFITLRKLAICMLLALLAAATLSRAALHEPALRAPQSQNPTDEDLRTFLGIRTLRGLFTVPKEAAGYYPVTLFFVDGKEVARVKGPVLTRKKPGEQQVNGEAQLLWKTEGGKVMQAAIVDGGNKIDLMERYPHWDKFSSSASRPFNAGDDMHYDSIALSAVIAANEPDSHMMPNLNANNITAFGKYVVAIGVAYDTDYDKLETQFLAR